MTRSLMATLGDARDAGVPLVAINTSDQAKVIEDIKAQFDDTSTPIFRWDIISGMVPLNQAGQKTFASWKTNGAKAGAVTVEATVSPVEAMRITLGVKGVDPGNPAKAVYQAPPLPAGGIVIMLQMHRYIDNPETAQCIWNLRDPYKADQRTLIILSPMISLPMELIGDVVIMNDHPPTEEKLQAIAEKMYKATDGKIKEPTPDEIRRVVDGVIGLQAFTAEQAIAMSLVSGGTKGMDFESLWSHKKEFISQTKGLSILEDLGNVDLQGAENVVRFLELQLRYMRCIVFVDEIEKAVAGSRSDSTGVTQDQVQNLLSEMADHEYRGIMCVGPGGTGKSLLAKSMARKLGIICIKFDLGAMKGSLVGQSEQYIRAALRTIDTVSQGKAFWIATCNSISSLPPELRRRFNRGTFFVDLPSPPEREALWAYYKARHNILDDDSQINDGGWTGAEIATVCENAHEMSISIEAASNYIVPVCAQDPEGILKLRAEAQGRYISASYPGKYQMLDEIMSASTIGRKITVR